MTFIEKLIYKGRFCFAICSGFVLDYDQSLSSSKTVGKNTKQMTLTGTLAGYLLCVPPHGFSRKRETARSLVSYSSRSCHAT